MAIDFAELEAMAADGATVAQVIAHLRRKEAKRAPKRERDKLRQRAIRRDTGRHAATCGDVATTIVAETTSATSPSADPPTKQTSVQNVPPHPPKDNNTPAAATERAGEKLISEEAHALADQVMGLCGVETGVGTPPGWCGAAHAVQHWLTDGATAEVIRLAVERSMARRRAKGQGPPNTAAYFNLAVADECRRAAQAPKQREMFLHVVEGGNADKRGNGNKRTVQDVARDLLEQQRDKRAGTGD